MNETKILVNIIYPFELNDELKDIIESSGYKNSFLKKYQKSLKFLEGLKTR